MSVSRRRIVSVAVLAGATIVLATPGCNRQGSAPSATTNTPVPAAASTGPAWFEDVAPTAGPDFVHVNGSGGQFQMPEIVGGGVAWLDYDNDEDLDLYFVQSGTLGEGEVSPPNQLYRNDEGIFVDVTDASGTGDTGYGMGVATGDYDHDGDTDIYITNYGPNTLLRNNGDGTFTDVTAASGTGDEKWGAGAAFLDFDADGDLDLYIANYIYWTKEVERECFNAFGHRDYCMPTAYEAPAHDTLYRNEGDGTFTDISLGAGIHEDLGNGLGVVCGDYNGDGREDIYVANDGMRNILWINQGDGRFLNQALLLGCAVDVDGREKAGMGVSAVDVDDDGDLDLLVVNLDNESDSFYRNQGEFFTEEAASVGLSRISRAFTRFGVAFVDLNNDGALDIYQANGKVTTQEGPFVPGGDVYAEPNVLVRGTAAGRFEEVSPRGGTAQQKIHISRAAAFGDFDNDGGIDVLVTNLNDKPYLLRNIVSDRGHWIGFRVLEASGGDAIGATVRFTAGSRSIVRDVRTGYSYFAANDPRVHVGLGETTGVSSVTVRYSDGTSESFEGEFDADQYVTLRRGEGRSIQ